MGRSVNHINTFTQDLTDAGDDIKTSFNGLLSNFFNEFMSAGDIDHQNFIDSRERNFERKSGENDIFRFFRNKRKEFGNKTKNYYKRRDDRKDSNVHENFGKGSEYNDDDIYDL